MTASINFSANGVARFAYNGENGDPWHRLGTDVRGVTNPLDVLALGSCDYTVEKFPVFTKLPDGTFVEVERKYLLGHDETVLGDEGFTTVRTHYRVPSVTDEYEVEQNAKAVEFALDIVAASGQLGQVDTVGALHDGRTFFVTVQLDPITVGPDEVRRYIVVCNGHGDGPLQVFLSTVRVVCSNTLAMAKASAEGRITIRHTASKDARKLAAQAAMAARFEADERFAAQAAVMLATPVNALDIRTVVSDVFGGRPTDDERKRAQTNWDQRLGEIRATYRNERNAQRVGENGWALYNAFTEYVDWQRPRTTDLSRAIQATDPQSAGTALKVKAAEKVLALA